MKALKWIGIIVGLVLILVVSAAVLVPLLVDPNDYRDEIEAVVEESTQRDLEITGDIELSVWPSLSLEMDKVTLSNPPGFDQQVKVTPHVSGSLPIAGAALGGVGAGVGAVIWLAEKVLDTKIVDEAAASRYHITGPWSSPAIERLVNTETEKESAGR
ncbi:MAG: AsmA family protein [Gammaproteobacteria bacterium]|nr:AsmA family protein [Gammaproteobacteria bacterium]